VDGLGQGSQRHAVVVHHGGVHAASHPHTTFYPRVAADHPEVAADHPCVAADHPESATVQAPKAVHDIRMTSAGAGD
jgi:hypothetical protein